ncbi:glycerophosphodiester phosphodiesterase [Staphylococcus lutrae]|uniref:Glycerophosphodiester phosphodiesterase n=1 Tax=Staphylococcus lutrae TaxID=155085 RepID=A0AAC9WIJ1_9STAP|nr:glycerophosphodiester phosphodiesterase family protein [Staphylococcus lutrae]ARJ50010.1 glycerophosphodiester phosphodiesterase [Staphylococcus lutrae]PNZ36401.1 glycerophosphodiester phosphodiesterase [Staphylococcus lutrae]
MTKLMRPTKAFQIVAHRGFSQQYPENTRAAYIAALSQPIDMLEIDLHMTKDRFLVAIHDETIDRTSNHVGAVRDFTLEALRTFDFGSWKGGGQSEGIMTFDEVLMLAKQYSKTLLIEIKQPQQYPGMEEAVIATIKQHHFPFNRVIIQSFDQLSIQKLHEMAPEIRLGVLLSQRHYRFKQPSFERLASFSNFANPNYKLVNKKWVQRAHQYHLKVIPYTVNQISVAKRLIAMGVDGIISDAPQQLFEL